MRHGDCQETVLSRLVCYPFLDGCLRKRILSRSRAPFTPPTGVHAKLCTAGCLVRPSRLRSLRPLREFLRAQVHKELSQLVLLQEVLALRQFDIPDLLLSQTMFPIEDHSRRAIGETIAL